MELVKGDAAAGGGAIPDRLHGAVHDAPGGAFADDAADGGGGVEEDAGDVAAAGDDAAVLVALAAAEDRLGVPRLDGKEDGVGALGGFGAPLGDALGGWAGGCGLCGRGGRIGGEHSDAVGFGDCHIGVRVVRGADWGEGGGLQELARPADKIDELLGEEAVGLAAEDAPAERGGGVVLFHVAQEALGAVVAAVGPYAALHLDGDAELGDGEVEAPAAEGVETEFGGWGEAGALLDAAREKLLNCLGNHSKKMY